jgi:hypothetical protein
MRKLIFGMNVTLDGYIAAPATIGWAGRRATSCSSGGWTRSGRAACRCMGASYGDDELLLADRRRAAPRNPGEIEFNATGGAEGGVLLDNRQGGLEHPPGHRRRGRPHRLKAEHGGPMGMAAQRSPGLHAGPGTTVRAGHLPVLVGGGVFFTALDSW